MQKLQLSQQVFKLTLVILILVKTTAYAHLSNSEHFILETPSNIWNGSNWSNATPDLSKMQLSVAIITQPVMEAFPL